MRAVLNFKRCEMQRTTRSVEMQSETIGKAHSKNPAISRDLLIQDYYEHSEDAEYAEGNAGEAQMPSICERSLPYPGY